MYYRMIYQYKRSTALYALSSMNDALWVLPCIHIVTMLTHVILPMSCVHLCYVLLSTTYDTNLLLVAGLDKSVHACAFAHERLQSPVSYVGIDMLSRTILKTMYRTISNSTFDDESRWNTTRFRSGTESNLPAAQDKQVLYSPAHASIQ